MNLRSHTHPSAEQGFSLIELIVVALLLGMLSTILYSSLRLVMQGKEALHTSSVLDTTARSILSRMTKEISSAAQIALTPQKKTPEDPALASQQYLLGIKNPSNPPGSDMIRFVSLGSAQSYYSGRGNSGTVEIDYRLELGTEHGTSFGKQSTYILVRGEAPAGVTALPTIKKQRVTFPLTDNVVELHFRYRKGEAWVESWTGRSEQLPTVVEITLRLQGEDKKIYTYKTAVALNAQTGSAPST